MKLPPIKLSRRGESARPDHVTNETHPATMRLISFAAQNPGVNAEDYPGCYPEFKADQRHATQGFTKFRQVMLTFPGSDQDVIEASVNQRMEWCCVWVAPGCQCERVMMPHLIGLTGTPFDPRGKHWQNMRDGKCSYTNCQAPYVYTKWEDLPEEIKQANHPEWRYCAGQNYPTEFRWGAKKVAENAVGIAGRRLRALSNPVTK